MRAPRSYTWGSRSQRTHRSNRVKLEERIPCRIPLSNRAHPVAGWRSCGRFCAGVTPAALASSRSIGAPRLHEWIDIREPALSTNKISSRVAPASSAARMCRRVPSGLRLVHAAFIARLINSTVLRGKTPELHGLVVIFAQASAHAGSHSRSCASAASHGPVSLRSILSAHSKSPLQMVTAEKSLQETR